MDFVQNPTYLLAPQWTFRPGGPIAIGNIIVDPFKPHVVCSYADPSSGSAYATDTACERNWRMSQETARRFDVSMWSVFLEKIQLKVGASRSNVRHGEYTMDVLETTYLLRHPSHEEIHERCNSPAVKPFMNMERIKAKPVYMITGLKIAKGFAVKQSSSSDRAAHAQVGVEVSPEVSVGAQVSGSKGQREQHGFEAMQDIIFGYQLLKIEPKGWGKRKQLHYGEFMKRKKSGIKDPESVDGEASLPAAGEFQEMSTDIQSVTLDDGDAGHGVIVFQAPDEEDASE
ncbi:hypothetical protein CTAM01_11154 [Colletotrichum tamarilloi]|uniref:Uncharacterized protein n=1 Tax=Colletotrichum tamarilloi TaxID=1209934 RepID=A0ABQ9QYG8_9PEZI|nr:uncharacterized protein CTAM01_11154 [Colletotrichum tamarilloi]KAK1489199.1 hypothetical protein CTAM01_11154 [Colletotrichum tamarilloi]